MDRFRKFTRTYTMDIWDAVTPSDVTVVVAGTGAVTPIAMTNSQGGNNAASGGCLQLLAPAYNDAAQVTFPGFIPYNFDEIHVQFLINIVSLFTTGAQPGMDLGVIDAGATNRLFILDSGQCIVRKAGSQTADGLNRSLPVGVPTWFEIEMKPSAATPEMSFYIDGLLESQVTGAAMPSFNLVWTPRMLCQNTQTPSTSTKEIDILQVNVELIKWAF